MLEGGEGACGGVLESRDAKSAEADVTQSQYGELVISNAAA